MNLTNISVDILKTDEDLIAHEKALFRNFHATYPDYSRCFFTLLDKNRLRPIIPYESQVIYGIKYTGMLLCAGSFCIDPSQRYEIEEMGFKIDKSDSVCEGLHLYSTLTQTINLNIEIYRKLLSFAFNDLLKRKINTIYSSCSGRLKKLYRYVGFSVIDEIMFFNEREYLLKMEITPDFEKAVFNLERIK